MTAVSATLRLRRESTLRSRAARGDAAAFSAVYERHHQALYRYCRSILHHEEDAQDALQSTMTRAFAALQDEQRDFELRPWLFRIAHNEAISILRKRRTTTELEDIPMPADLDERVSEREELRLLTIDLADLPERQRAALVLRELNGLSHAEIAVVLGLSAATVKQTIFEARSSLFSAREGREMPCEDVRRMLSDGDGRVLRGRGVRAHLRSCKDCRRFQADIGQRSKRLAMLAPPLPTVGAAALLAQILGGGTAAKLLACVAVAGGGATVAAVEFYKPPPRASAETPAKPRERERPATPSPTPTATPGAVLASTQDKPPARSEAKEKSSKQRKPVRTERDKRASSVAPAAGRDEPATSDDRRAAKQPATGPANGEKPAKAEQRAKAETPAKSEKPAKTEKPATRDKVKREKPAESEQRGKSEKPKTRGKPDKEQAAEATPPPQAVTESAPAEPPPKANKQERERFVPPGHAKQGDDDDDGSHGQSDDEDDGDGDG